MPRKQYSGPPRGGPGKPPPARHSPAVAPGGAEGGVAAKFTGTEHEVNYEELGLIDETVRPFGWKRRPLPLLTVCEGGSKKDRMEHEFLDYRALRPPFWFTHRGHRKTFLRQVDRRPQPGEKILYHFITTYFGDIFSNDPYDWTGILLDGTWVIREVDADKRDIWLEYPKKGRISTDNSFLFFGDKYPVRVMWCFWPQEGVTVENYLVDIGDRAIVPRTTKDDFIERMYTRVKLHGQIVDTGLKRDQLAFRIPEEYPHSAEESKRWNDVKNHPHFSKYITEYPGGYYAYLMAPEKTPHWGFMWKSGEPKPTYIRWQDLSIRVKPEDAKPEKHGPKPEYYLDRLYDFWTRKHQGEIHEIIATVKPDQTPLSMPHSQRYKPERFTKDGMKKKLDRLKVILKKKEGQPVEPDDGNQAAGGHDPDTEQRSPATDQPSARSRSSTTNEPRASGSGGSNSGNQGTQTPQRKTSSEEKRGGQQPQADSRVRVPSRSPTRGRPPSVSRSSVQPESTGAIPKVKQVALPQEHQGHHSSSGQNPQSVFGAPKSPSPPVNPPSSSVAAAASNTGTGNVTHPPQLTTRSLVPPDPQGYIFSYPNYVPITYFPEHPADPRMVMVYTSDWYGKPVFMMVDARRVKRYVLVTMGGRTREYPTMSPDPATRGGGNRAPTSHRRKRRHPKERDRSESPLRSKRSDSTEPSDKRTKK